MTFSAICSIKPVYTGKDKKLSMLRKNSFINIITDNVFLATKSA